MSRYPMILAAMVGLGACVPDLISDDVDPGTSGPSTWTAPDNDWPVSEPPAGLAGEGFQEGEVVPDFRLLDQKGQTVSLWQFYGKIVVLDISTMWCSPCRELAEGAEETWQAFADDGFVYLTVLPENVGRETPSLDDLNAWAGAYGITQPIVSDPDRAFSEDAVPGEAFPQVYIIGRDLVVADRLSVPTDANLRAAVRQIIE